MAAVTHRLAAVVRFRTVVPWRKMRPAPMKPMPLATSEATRVTSNWMLVARCDASNSRKPIVEITPNSPAPSATARCVRRPAG
jgi:hypothetical protein